LAAWKLTVREGSNVSRTNFDDLDSAITAAREKTAEILTGQPMKAVKAIRDYEPAQLVRARIEISGKGLISPPTAGVDIQGDLTLTGFTGGIRRKPLEGDSLREVFREIREALEK
jgi:hypothetical protein